MIPFYDQTPHGTDELLVYPFVSGWTLGLFLLSGCYEQYCCELMYQSLWGQMSTLLLGEDLRVELLSHVATRGLDF